MARVLCSVLAAVCSVIFLATESSGQRCFSVQGCLAPTYASCMETIETCSDSSGCVSGSSTGTIFGIKATGWSKGCLNGTTCSINNECRTTHTGVIKHITCASCCQGDLCNTGSPPASASSLGAFSPLVMSTLTVVAFLFMN